MDTLKTNSPNKLGRPDRASLASKARGEKATMDKLLAAGIEVFSAHGYDAATTKLVAKQAGINESLINRYFDGKAGLLLAITRAYLECEKTQGPLGYYPEGETLEQELRNFFQAMFTHHKERQSLLKIFISRAMVDTKVRDELKRLTRRGAIPLVLERMQKFQRQGLIRRDVDVEKAAVTVCNTSLAMSFINHIVMGTDGKFILEALFAFAHDYARGIGPGSH